LGDWLDAFRHFDIDLYPDDSQVHRFVLAAAARRE
jgi:hypothetical protein